MSNNESPAARYRRLARECLEVAHTFPNGESRTVLLQMAQVWQRLSDEYAASNTPYFSRLRASDQPCNSNSRVSPRTTRRNRPPQALARFDPLDPQWPLLNLAVARFGIALVRFPTDSCGNFVPYIFTSPTKLGAPGG